MAFEDSRERSQKLNDRIIRQMPGPPSLSFMSSPSHANQIPVVDSVCTQEITRFDEDVLNWCHSTDSYKYNLNERITKVVVLGDVSVGKSSLIQRFVKNTFNNDYKATIGVDFEVEKFYIIGKSFNLQIWDTAGQERFRCIAAAYYRGSQAIILTFDLNQKESLLNTKIWLQDALEVCKVNEKQHQMPVIFLVGLKKDLLDQRSKSYCDKITHLALQYAKLYNAEFWQISASRGENVKEFFLRLASLLFNRAIKFEIQQNAAIKSSPSAINISSKLITSRDKNKDEAQITLSSQDGSSASKRIGLKALQSSKWSQSYLEKSSSYTHKCSCN